MGSFDKSYYDILSKYQDVLKEGMSVQPIVYKKTGNTYVPANDLDLKIVPPQLLFTKSDNPATPFVPYQPQNTGVTATNNPAQATNTAQTTNPAPTTSTGTNPAPVTNTGTTQSANQPSISVTGEETPQSSMTSGNERIQYTTPTKTAANVTPSNRTAVRSVPPSRPSVQTPSRKAVAR